MRQVQPSQGLTMPTSSSQGALNQNFQQGSVLPPQQVPQLHQPSQTPKAPSIEIPAAKARAASPPHPSRPPSPPISFFTEEQREALRLQIYAFKILAAKHEVPEQLKRAILESKYARTDAAGKPLSTSQMAGAAPQITTFMSEKGLGTPVTTSNPATPTGALSTMSPSSLTTPIAGQPQNPLLLASQGNLSQSALQSIPRTPLSTLKHARAPSNQDGLKSISKVEEDVPKLLPDGRPVPLKLLRVPEEKLKDPRIFIPHMMPLGLDPYELSDQRNWQIHNRVNNRVRELEQSLQTIRLAHGEDDATFIEVATELKALKLLDRQKRLRRDLTARYHHNTLILAGLDSSMYTKHKRYQLRDLAPFEKLEQTQLVEREQRERAARKEYCNAIITHGRELLSWHRNRDSNLGKLGNSVIKFHAVAEKEEQKRIQRLQQERLQALKANDEEAYLKLIDQAKDTRITQILGQTQQYLSNLTANIASQQQDIAEAPVLSEEAMQNVEIDSSTDYYSSAHKIHEKVTEQSTLLVGGRLKEYQIKGLQWMVSVLCL
ncbi:hypothetical protein HDU96_001920 [Phlyctochytrium bullatum]|nr:hypothetical protein HDU96_001920 [Phlyctochytrium bullatum]